MTTTLSDASLQKIQKAQRFIGIVTKTGLIEAIFYTGSISYGTAQQDDDIDLLIVTCPGLLYTTRFVCTIVAWMLCIKRSRGQKEAPDKLCMNIWLDATDLSIPPVKRSAQGLRDLAHLLPAYDPHKIQSSLQQITHTKKPIPRYLYLEKVLYKLQRWYMQKHITHEIITPTQAWFHPKLF